MPDFEREMRLRSKQKLDTRLQFILSGEGYGERSSTGRWIEKPETLTKWCRRSDSENEIKREVGQGYREVRAISYYMRFDPKIVPGVIVDPKIVPGVIVRDSGKELTVSSVEIIGRKRYMLVRTGAQE